MKYINRLKITPQRLIVVLAAMAMLGWFIPKQYGQAYFIFDFAVAVAYVALIISGVGT